MNNFNPKDVISRLEALEQKVGGEVREVAADTYSGFEARINRIELAMERLEKLLPILEAKVAGQLAGVGAAESEGVVIPAAEIGAYSNGTDLSRVDPATIDPPLAQGA